MNIKPPGRKAHRKSRTGCNKCKERRIKCGEERPSCLNCIKLSVQCNFAELPSASNSASSVSSPAWTNRLSVNTLSGAGGFSIPSDKPSNISQVPQLNILDLELLHHFSTSTGVSLSTNPIIQAMWGIRTPQIAFSNEFVMRGILAVSALHLARLRPERSKVYVPYSLQQYQAALQEAATILPEVTAENCTALQLSAVLTLIYTFGSPQKPPYFVDVGGSRAPEWLSLFRGIKAIAESSSDTLFSGPLAPLFQAGKEREKLRETFTGGIEHLGELRHVILDTVSDDSKAQTYMCTIDGLEKSFAVMHSWPAGTCEMTDVFVWLFDLSEEYLELLKEWTQESLAIFAYLSVLFQRIECYWWMEGWSVHLISQLYPLLDEEHRLWIRWPIEQIGWIPN
ncbi:hypothetical protein ACEPPN_013132 [Leptodophora sp. 'Broadleaf-Isolate-01']